MDSAYRTRRKTYSEWRSKSVGAEYVDWLRKEEISHRRKLFVRLRQAIGYLESGHKPSNKQIDEIEFASQYLDVVALAKEKPK